MKAIFLMQEALFDQVYTSADRARLAASLGEETPFLTPAAFPAQLKQLRDVRYIFSGWDCPLLDLSVRRQLPQMEAIFHAAGTVRGMVSPDLWTAGVRVSSAAEINADPVADFTFAAAVFAAKFVFAQAAAARSRAEFQSPAPMGLFGATVGLIAFSRVGSRVAERFRASGAHVLVYDPFLTPAEADRQGVAKTESLDALFAQSDLVSCHAPLLPETLGLVRGSHLRRLRRGGHFINTARGAIVAEAEMIAVLRERPDLSATLDVTTVEPLPLDSPLRDLPNVILTPHLAGSQDRECRRLGLFAIEEYERLARGEPLLGEISARSLTFIA